MLYFSSASAFYVKRLLPYIIFILLKVTSVSQQLGHKTSQKCHLEMGDISHVSTNLTEWTGKQEATLALVKVD